MTPPSDNPLSPAMRHMLDAATEIGENPSAAELAFIARQLVQATLPHRDPKTNTWSRKNGHYTLSLQTGFHENGQPIGLPYGVVPRLLMFWLVTEAVRTKNPLLQLGDSLATFMRTIGLDPTHGGKKGDGQRLETQMRRLFAGRISFRERLSDNGRKGEAVEFVQIARSYVLWWDSKQPHQGALWHSSVKLDSEFFKAILAAPVPVDLRAITALKRSPLALDLYAWATYTAYRTHQTGQSRSISWQALHRQLGAEYHDIKDFKKKAKKALRKIQTVYPDLGIEYVRGGVMVLPCNPAVTIKPTSRTR